MDTMMEKERVTSFVSGSRVTRMGTWGKVNQQLGGDGEDGPNRELYSSCSECCEMNVLFHLLTTQTTHALPTHFQGMFRLLFLPCLLSANIR